MGIYAQTWLQYQESTVHPGARSSSDTEGNVVKALRDAIKLIHNNP